MPLPRAIPLGDRSSRMNQACSEFESGAPAPIESSSNAPTVTKPCDKAAVRAELEQYGTLLTRFQHPPVQRCPHPLIAILDSNIMIIAADAVLKGELHAGDPSAELLSIFAALSDINNCTFLVPRFVEQEIEMLHHRHNSGAQIQTKKSLLTYQSTGVVLSLLEELRSTDTPRTLSDERLLQPKSVDLSLVDLAKILTQELQMNVVLTTNDRILQLIATIHDVPCASCHLSNESAILLFTRRTTTLHQFQQLFGAHFEKFWTDEYEFDFANDPVTVLTKALGAVDATKLCASKRFSDKVKRYHSDIIHFYPTWKESEMAGKQLLNESAVN